MARGSGAERYPRLTPYDVHCLRVETAARPLHLGILALADGASLVDPEGGIRIEAVRGQVERRLAAVPELRRVVHRPGRLAGRPIWVDDPRFRVEHHVHTAELPAPGDDAALRALVETLLASPLQRDRPLWRMWLVPGLEGGRVGILLAVHHALADGMTAMRMVRTLVAPVADGARGGGAGAAVAPAGETPTWVALAGDHARSTAVSWLRLLRPGTWRTGAAVARAIRDVNVAGRNLPVSPLNAPVGPARRLATLRLDQAAARRVARDHECGVNDVVLGVIAGGVRALLLERGEAGASLRPRAGVAVALFSPGHGREAGNDIGTLHVALPCDEPDPAARLGVIAAGRARAKASPMVAIEPLLRAHVGRFGFLRRSLERQRLVNLSTTYLPGPPSRLDAFGAPVLELVPIAPLAGNLGLSFVTLSYAGGLTVAVRADGDRFPDLDVLVDGMEADWTTLAAGVAGEGASVPA